MKRTLLLLLAGLATLAVAASETKSLYDYYLTLPAETLRLFLASGKPLDAEAKKTIVKVRDDRNGYLELDAKQLDGAESNPVLALFVRRGKTPLIAVATALGDSTYLNFMTEAGGQWADVSAEVLPKIDDAFLDAQHRKIYPTFPQDRKFSDFAGAIVKYTLPRNGTTIVATSLYEDEKIFGMKIFELTWDGGKFTAR